MTPLLTSALLRTQSDERLVLLVRDGQDRAFEAIVDRYRKPLQRYCERALPMSRAEDVVQQVFTKAWCAIRAGTEVRAVKPWLYRIAATTVLETAQAPGYEYSELRRSLLAPDRPEDEFEQQAVIRRTLAGLAALPASQREALLRDAIDGQSRAQIAEALGVTEGAVRQLLHRARTTLRAAATAITPLPLVSWLATSGSAPVAGTALEGGAAGTLGVAGIAKASAIMATAGLVVSGSAAVHHHHGQPARKAKSARVSHALVRQRTAEVRPARVVAVARSSGEVQSSRETRRPGADRASEAERSNDGSQEAARSETSGPDERQSEQRRSEQSQPAEPRPAEPQPAEQQAETSGGDGGDSGRSGSGSDGGDGGD